MIAALSAYGHVLVGYGLSAVALAWFSCRDRTGSQAGPPSPGRRQALAVTDLDESADAGGGMDSLNLAPGPRDR